MDDFPTPPLPDATAYTRVSDPGGWNTIFASGRARIRAWWSVFVGHDPNSTDTPRPRDGTDGPGDAVDDPVRMGQPETVSRTDGHRPVVTISTASTMPSSVIGRWDLRRPPSPGRRVPHRKKGSWDPG